MKRSNTWAAIVEKRPYISVSPVCCSLKLFSTRLRTIQHNIRDPSNHAIAGAPSSRIRCKDKFSCAKYLTLCRAIVEVATAGCFVAQSRNGALALTSLGLPGVCLNLLESQVEEVQLASCRLLLGEIGSLFFNPPSAFQTCTARQHCHRRADACCSARRRVPKHPPLPVGGRSRSLSIAPRPSNAEPDHRRDGARHTQGNI